MQKTTDISDQLHPNVQYLYADQDGVIVVKELV